MMSSSIPSFNLPKELGDLVLDSSVPDSSASDKSAPENAADKLSSDTTLSCLCRLLEVRDSITHFHSRRVSQLAYLVCHAMQIEASACIDIAKASLLHDIGKLALPLEIVLKPTGLTAEEMKLIRTHTTLGFSILSGTGEPLLDLAAQIALEHHEAFDGSGYPHGLAGHQISLPARIAGVCDVYDALRRDRPYRVAMSHEEAMKVMVSGDERTVPGQFDPDVLAQLVLHSRQIADLYAGTSETEILFD